MIDGSVQSVAQVRMPGAVGLDLDLQLFFLLMLNRSLVYVDSLIECQYQ